MDVGLKRELSAVHVINPLTSKSTKDLEPGELFVTSFGSGYALTLLLRRLEGGRSLFGIVSGPNFAVPELYATDYSGHCLSYGKDWALELTPGAETVSSGYYQQDEDANLFVDGGSVVLRFRYSEYALNRRVSFDLQTQADHDLTVQAAPVYRWRIWQSAVERSRLGAKPIFEAGI